MKRIRDDDLNEKKNKQRLFICLHVSNNWDKIVFFFYHFTNDP